MNKEVLCDPVFPLNPLHIGRIEWVSECPFGAQFRNLFLPFAHTPLALEPALSLVFPPSLRDPGSTEVSEVW